MAVESFLEFLADQPAKIPYDQVSHKLVTGWIVHLLRVRKLKERVVNGRLSALRGFYRWLRIENYIYGNPLQDVRCLKATKTLPKPISEPWVMKILKASSEPAVGKLHNGRARQLGDRALFETFYATGGRISQMQGMNIGHIDFDSKTILTESKGKECIVHFGRFAEKAIGKWLAFRKKRGEILSPDSPLWVGARWLRMDKKTMRRHLKEIAVRAGYTERIWPHRFRHSFCTHLLEHGADLRKVQELAVHENIVSTTLYTGVTSAVKRKAYEDAHPRA